MAMRGRPLSKNPPAWIACDRLMIGSPRAAARYACAIASS
jgi:hypothetical protein